jgi:hypothetical protein
VAGANVCGLLSLAVDPPFLTETLVIFLRFLCNFHLAFSILRASCFQLCSVVFDTSLITTVPRSTWNFPGKGQPIGSLFSPSELHPARAATEHSQMNAIRRAQVRIAFVLYLMVKQTDGITALLLFSARAVHTCQVVTST